MGRKSKRESDPDEEPWLVFRACRASCTRDCNEHGYFWGPGHEKEAWRGKRASWPKDNGYSGAASGQ